MPTPDPNLVFEGLRPASPDLVFGADLVAPAVNITITGTMPGLTVSVILIPPVELDVVATLPPLTVSVNMRPSTPVTITGQMPGLALVAEVIYESNTQRPTVGRTVAHWQDTEHQSAATAQGQQNTRSAPVGWQAFWEKVTNGSQTIGHPLPDAFDPLPIAQRSGQQDATRLHNATGYSQQDATRTHQHRTSGFQDGVDFRHDTFFPHQDATRTRTSRSSEYQNAEVLHLSRLPERHQVASAFLKGWGGVFQDGVPPPPGITIYIPPVVPGPEPCYFPDPDLLFSMLWSGDTNLVFICDNYVEPPPVKEPIVIPVQRVYIVVNNLALRRVSDNAVVPAFSMSLSLDVASWSWGFSASLPGTAQALVEPTNAGPVELKATINGTEFRVLAEQVGRERAFGQSSIRISGRGHNAVLDAPYSPAQVFSNDSARTHQQLFDDVLTFNGVSLGYTIDYGLEAWSIPEGVWNHQGTHISALTTLAKAGGAYLIPHPSAQSFKVRHLYPTKPWEWNLTTPDFILPSSAVTREGVTWTEKPGYTRVFVSGQDQGVLGQVTRAGTAGDVLAPMVTDPLITAAAAARQRGLAVLGNTGRQMEHNLRLPVLPATGIIQPGALIEYTDAAEVIRGIVRSVQVEAQMPDVYQTIGVECHV